MPLIKFPDSVQYVLGAISIILLVLAFIPYTTSVVRKQITPRPLTWIGWTLLMGISFISQLFEKGFALNQIPMCMSIAGCLIISLLSVKNGNIKLMDWVCLVLGVICTIVYLTTKDAWLTTILAIIADILIAIPTLHNAWKNPLAEKSITWTFGAVAYFITLIACKGYDMLYVLFPLYLFMLNSTMILLTSRKALS
jgi:hypothetical protein